MATQSVRIGWRPYASQVLSSSLTTTGLILHLDSGNSSSYSGAGTTWTDLSGNNRNATLYNGTSYSSLDGGKIVFDGINDYAEISNPPVFGSGDFSIEIWFKRKESTLNWDGCYLLSKWISGANPTSNEWQIGFGDTQGTSHGNNLVFTLEAQGGGFYGIISDEILINTWYQGVITRQGGELKMYINGSLRTTSTPSITYYGALGTKSVNSAGRRLRIAVQDNTDNLHGNVEVPIVRMYNKVLSATEVAQNYLSNKSRFMMEDNPQILNNLILDINPSLYVPNSPTLINPANVGNNIKVWGNETDSTTAPVWNKKWFTFDGINDYLEIKDAKSYMFGTQSFSVSTWTKLKNANFGWSGGTITKWYTGASPGSNNWSFGMSDYSVLKPAFGLDSNGTFYSVSSPDTISTYVWYHLVFVRDGGTMRIYVDGALKGTNSPAGFATRSISNVVQPLYVGRIGAGYNTIMDSGRTQIYNKALTATEVSSLYNTQKTDFIVTNGLKLYIDPSLNSSFTTATYFTVNDVSGSGLVGSLVNGVGFTASNDGAFTFDGINDYITIPDDSSNRFGNQFSMSLSFYWDGVARTNNTLFAKRNGDPYNQYCFTINNADPYNGGTGRTFGFFARPDQGSAINFPNSGTVDLLLAYDLGTTPKNVHATVTVDSNSQKLYINGILVSSISINLTGKTFNISGRQIAIAATRDNGSGYMGYTNTRIYSAQLYNRTLTSAEVQHNFEVLRTRLGL
jgi:hypothetical protein